MTNTNCCVCSIKTPDDGQYVCPKHVEFDVKIKLRNSASCWLLLYEEIWEVNGCDNWNGLPCGDTAQICCWFTTF